MWGRTNRLTMLAYAVEVSIRVPRGGVTLAMAVQMSSLAFQSTCPVWGRTSAKR